ncbi:sensor histidine kinase [Leptolyngbya sp. PCC 6406]|uniref:sensor histidine kinase n=1 Tax=Leptolyngbya sp. PCC 6406 TaxID=1173264 RepID=UPI0002AC993A|nr:ATP-binding protein [Leptolyngbya sp. PCC 6406]
MIPLSLSRWLPDPRSIQFRLTAGLVLASALGIGGVSGWMGWRMQHRLLESHRQNVIALSNRFGEDVALYQAMMSTQEAVNQVIEYRVLGDMAIWVMSPEGGALAQSKTMSLTFWQEGGVAQQLQALPPDKESDLLTLGDRTVLLCISPLRVGEEFLGTLFIATDITADQRSLRILLRNLTLVSFTMVGVLAIAIALYVRRSLQPFHDMEQRVTTVTADGLNEARLHLDQAPTEVQALADAFDNTLARLADLGEQQRQLVENVSHELRTPLTLVQGYLQSTLRRCHTLTEIQRDGLEIAAAETGRTIHILQDLLVLARAGLGRLPLTLERTDLKTIVLEAAALATEVDADASLNPAISPTAPNRIDTQIAIAPLVARADPSALRQALMHLLANALQYSNADQTVVLRLIREGDWGLIQVCDRGRGIPLADQSEIFHPFYRVDSDRARTTGGTGLGLAIVKTLMEAMGGRVTVQSTLGQGSTFTLHLAL